MLSTSEVYLKTKLVRTLNTNDIQDYVTEHSRQIVIHAGELGLDLSSAFDIVDHNIFLEKLRVYGFSAETIGWFSSYLKERKQVVQVESCLSSPGELGEFGVP